MTRPTAKEPYAADGKDRLIALGVGLIALIVYVLTLCPTIFTDDCGEITTAVATGGVMHPPGYPLYSIIGGLLIRLIPYGEPAWRLGLLSAIPAAAAVSVIYFVNRRLGADRIWAAAGSAALAFSYTLWQQATKVETYALNALFVAVLLSLAMRYSQSGLRRDFLLTALMGGLALTNHLTIVWLMPALLLLSLPTLFREETAPRAKASGAWALLATGLACCLAPLALYGYEMYAAQTHPGGEVWGDPSNLHRLFLHVTGALYHKYFLHLSTAALIHRETVVMPHVLWRSMFLMLPLCGAGAFLALAEKGSRRLAAAGLIVAAAGYIVCNSLYGIPNIFEYYTPVVVALMPLGALGSQWAAGALAARLEQAGATRRRSTVTAACAILAGVAPLVLCWTSCDRRNATYVRTFAENQLNTLPLGAILVARGDNHAFPLLYAQDVLGIRRDVALLPLFDTWRTPLSRDLNGWTARKLDRDHPEFHATALLADYAANRPDSREHSPGAVLLIRALADGRPVFVSNEEKTDIAPGAAGPIKQISFLRGYTFIQSGICLQIVPITQIPDKREQLARELAAESRMRYDYASPALFDNEPDGPLTNKIYAYNLANTAILLADFGEWRQSFSRAQAAYDLDDTQGLVDHAYALGCMQAGRPADAIRAWRQAVANDPTNPIYRKNLQTALAQTASADAG